MFRPSSRLLAMMLAGMTSIRCLPKRIWPILSLLEPLHRSLAIQLPKFFASSKEKSTLNCVKSNAFIIGSTKFIFHMSEFKSKKEIILAITESDIDTHQHKRHIWLSMTAAKTLLERLGTSRISTFYRSSANSYMDVPITKFVDDERQRSIGFKLTTYRNGDSGLQISSRNLIEDKGQAMLVPLDGIAMFREKLANMIRNYEKLKEPNRPRAFEDLYNSSFFFEHKSYFLHLSKFRSTDEILLRLCEYNKETGKKRGVFMPIESTRTFFGLLKKAYEIIQSHEGRLSAVNQPLEAIYEKSFADQEHEYTVQVAVSEPNMRHLGDMVLRIKKQNLDNEALLSFIIIRSHGAHLLLEHFEKTLQEYDRLKPTLSDSEATKSSDLTDEHRKQMRNQELAAWKAEVEKALAELEPKNWKGTEEDRQKEFPNRKAKFAKKLEEIFKEYSDLA